jgi:Carboxypeptidase regulatory-like domain
MYIERAFVAFVVGVLCMSTVSAESHLTITGKVTDSKGAAVAKARVLIHWDPSSGKSGVTQDVSVLSDDNGTYLAEVPVGFYDVFVSAPAFTPTAAKVIVKEGQKAVLNAWLDVDPLVSKAIGGMEVEGVR